MNLLIETLNGWAEQCLGLAWPMLWQSSLLIGVLFALDELLRAKLRPAVRYALWLVVLVKLVLPPSLALPTGAGWWLRAAQAAPAPVRPPAVIVTYGAHELPAAPVTPALFTPVSLAPPPLRLSPGAGALVGSAAVSLGLLALIVLRWCRAARDVRQAAVAPAELNQLLPELPRWAQVRLSERPQSPALCGLFRPVILLPRSLSERLAPAELRAVLLHELFHLRRGDVWVNCVQALLQLLYWWHPLLWLANARIRQAREEAVDDAVMLALRDDAEAYAPALLEVARLALERPLTSLGLVGIFESHRSLRQRIQRLLDFHSSRKAGLTLGSAVMVLAFAAVAVPMGEAPTPAKKYAPSSPPPPPSAATNDLQTASPQVSIKTTFVEMPEQDSKEFLAGALTWNPTNWRGPAVLNSRQATELLASLQAKPDTYDVRQRSTSVASGSRAHLAGSPAEPLVLPVEVPALDLDDAQARHYWSHLTTPLAAASTSLPTAGPPVVGALPETAAFAEQPRTSRTLVHDGMVLYQMGRLDEARARFNQALALDPQNEAARYYTNLVAEAKGHDALQDYGVVISPRLGPSAPQLFTRQYKVDPNRLSAGLQAATGLATNAAGRTTIEALRNLFVSKGAELNPPKSLYYKDTEGRLYVRATRDDLDTIEQVLHTLLPVVPPQIHIACKFVEALQDAKAPGFDWFLGNVVMNGSNGPGGVAPSANNQGLTSGLRSAGSGPFFLNGVLTDPQYRVVLHALEQRDNTEVLAQPTVVTISGRQAQCKAVQAQTIVKGIKPQALSSPGLSKGDENSLFEVEPMEFGPELDVAPSLLADGFTMKLSLTASVVEFVGYETNRTNQVTVYVDGKRKQIQPPQPIVRQAKVSSEVNVWDGQTVVLGGLMSERMLAMKDSVPVLGGLPLVGGLFRSESRTTQKRNLMVFITPTLVDPAGNRIHSAEELPFSQNSIPPQPGR